MTHVWLRFGYLGFVSLLFACAQAEQLAPAPLVVGTGGAMGMDAGAMTNNGCPQETPATCGNGTLESGEQCDGGDPAKGIAANFGPYTCASVMPGTMGPLVCGCCMINTDMCVTAVPMGGTGG